MKKVVILVLIALVLIISCSKQPIKSIEKESSMPNKEKELARGLDLNSPELQTYIDELKKEESIWFKKISTSEVKLTIKKGNQFSPVQSKKVCENTCNLCSQRISKNLVSAELQQDKINNDLCVCSFDQEVNGGEYYSCMDEANRIIYSELFEGLIKQDPEMYFPKLNQMYFMFSNYDKEKVSDKLCDNVCSYCATKFGQELEFVSAPTLNEEGDLQCTCQTTDYSVNYYRVNSCVADLISIMPSK